MRALQGYAIGNALYNVGLVPENATNVEILMPMNGVATIRYEVNLDVDDLPKLAKALEQFAAESSKPSVQ